MICPKCGSDNISFQVVNESKLVKAHHSVVWWIFVGWWWLPIKWICFFWLVLIIKLCRGGKKKIVNVQKNIATCQACGNSWEYGKEPANNKNG